MSVLTEQITNAIVTQDYNGDGRLQDHAHLDIPGHDVQLVRERGSKWFTVFCDGDCAELTADRIEGWLTARLRR